MPMDQASFASRVELVGGEPARCAGALLFDIQVHTAHLVARSRRVVARHITEQFTGEAERIGSVTIQDLEQFADEWAVLVPDDAQVRATLAFLIGDQYLFTHDAVPTIRRALDLDAPAVQQAFQQLYHQPLVNIYAPAFSRGERWRWAWANLSNRIENLPPFWSVFAFTLTETIGAGILALPIALAGVGAIAGVIQLVILGLVNLITIASISEAVARNGSVRYGGAYFGQLVEEYLGRTSAKVFSLGLFLLNLVVLMAYYTGFAKTLTAATQLRPEIWALALFSVNLFFLRRQSLNATITVALIIGFVNLALILSLTMIGLANVKLDHLLYVNIPLLNQQPFDPSLLGLIFGVTLLAYFGHTSTANCAHKVLRHDPTGRALILGNLAAMTVAMVIYGLFVVALNGSIAPAILLSETGTALGPLAVQAGPIVHVFGSLFAILGIGMASVHFSLGLFNQTRERLPKTLSTPSRLWIGATPVIAVFLLTEWLLFNHAESFTGLIGFVGVLTAPLLAGIFPMLLLVASRRKGEFLPSVVLRILGNPIIVGMVYLIFVGSIFLHGLVIWDNPIQRVAALVVGVIVLAVTAEMVRQRIFTPRAVIELRVDYGIRDQASINIMANGERMAASVSLAYGNAENQMQAMQGIIPEFSRLLSATIELPKSAAREIKILIHRVMVTGVTESIPARVILGQDESESKSMVVNRPIVLPMDATATRVAIYFGSGSDSGT